MSTTGERPRARHASRAARRAGTVGRGPAAAEPSRAEAGPGSDRLLPRIAVVGAVAFGAWILYANRFFYHDDAYITLRYVWNALHGNGIVWNVGERVQGYSNTLHLFLVTALGAAGVDLVAASRAIGLASFVALVLAFWLYLRSFHGTNALRHVPLVLVVSSAPLIVWAIGGIGDTLFALLVSASCLLFVAGFDRPDDARPYAASGFLLGMSCVAHPDGSVFAGVAFFWLAATWRSRPLRSAAAFAIPCLVIMTAHLIGPYDYYGDFVPNTFYAKAANLTVDRLFTGARYVLAYALLPPFLPSAVVGLTVYGLATKRLRWSSKLTYLALIVAAFFGFVVFVGGDHMKVFRLLLPLVVPLSYMLFLLLDGMVDASDRRVVHGVTVAVILLAAMQLRLPQLNPRAEDRAALVGTAVGKYIAHAWPEGALVALNTAGSTPYYAPRVRFIDMLGLNDRHIARRHIDAIELPWQRVPGHLKGDGRYVLSRRPEFIILGPAKGHAISDPQFLSDLEMERDPRFLQNYHEHQVALTTDGPDVRDIVFTYYERNATP